MPVQLSSYKQKFFEHFVRNDSKYFAGEIFGVQIDQTPKLQIDQA